MKNLRKWAVIGAIGLTSLGIATKLTLNKIDEIRQNTLMQVIEQTGGMKKPELESLIKGLDSKERSLILGGMCSVKPELNIIKMKSSIFSFTEIEDRIIEKAYNDGDKGIQALYEGRIADYLDDQTVDSNQYDQRAFMERLYFNLKAHSELTESYHVLAEYCYPEIERSGVNADESDLTIDGVKLSKLEELSLQANEFQKVNMDAGIGYTAFLIDFLENSPLPEEQGKNSFIQTEDDVLIPYSKIMFYKERFEKRNPNGVGNHFLKLDNS